MCGNAVECWVKWGTSCLIENRDKASLKSEGTVNRGRADGEIEREMETSIPHKKAYYRYESLRFTASNPYCDCSAPEAGNIPPKS